VLDLPCNAQTDSDADHAEHDSLSRHGVSDKIIASMGT
jgi:hypothetical protein